MTSRAKKRPRTKTRTKKKAPPKKPAASPAPEAKSARTGATAEAMAAKQREISVSEFFAKNRHLLGFDNPRKAMLITVKEAVDNALDACEEGAILPEIYIKVRPLAETRFKITVRDNGPGIVKKQIEHIFGQLLYGSKFHRMKMSRGQQGIGISAAGMYGLMTTGKPVLIISKTSRRKPAHELLLKIDTTKNKAEVVSDTEHPEDDKMFPEGHGTHVVIELEGRYQKGRQSIDEYLEQTAIANPHARITYVTPNNDTVEFPRTVNDLPEEPREIKPHPKGIELGTLIQMLERTKVTQLGAFLQNDFCRVGLAKAKEICAKADMTNRTWIKQLGHAEAEALYGAIQEVKLTAPPMNCLVPIGSQALLAGLLKEVQAEFFSASSRPPAVYRGNPFQIEAAIAYGGKLVAEEQARVLRFANRVPLLYQQAACCAFKSVVETNWRGYELSQARNALPQGPLVVMLHMASVWVPFTSESKEAIADYDEIRKEMKLALQECGRKLAAYVRRRKRMQRQSDVRTVLVRYIGEIANGCEGITGTPAKKVYDALMKQVKRKTAEADAVLDEEGKVIASLEDDDVVILEDRRADGGGEDFDETLFGENNGPKRKKKKTTKKQKRVA
ncbi:MAG: DNA topoisomerase VI subunit B [Planctomycetota bacterium]|jgi:DNA topoisomerase-6 subunit B